MTEIQTHLRGGDEYKRSRLSESKLDTGGRKELPFDKQKSKSQETEIGRLKMAYLNSVEGRGFLLLTRSSK